MTQRRTFIAIVLILLLASGIGIWWAFGGDTQAPPLGISQHDAPPESKASKAQSAPHSSAAHPEVLTVKDRPLAPTPRPRLPGRVLSGQVLGVEGTGLANTELWLVDGNLARPQTSYHDWPERENLRHREIPNLPATLSDVDGRFEIPYDATVSLASGWRILAYAEDYAPLWTDLSAATLAAPLSIRLALEGKVKITIKDPQRLFSRDIAQVAFFPAASFAAEALPTKEQCETESTAVLTEVETIHARFAGALPLGDFRAFYWNGSRVVGSEVFTLAPRKRPEIEITIPSGAVVFGKIIGRDGLPMAGKKVWLGLADSLKDQGFGSALCDKDGNYRINDAKTGTLWLYVDSDAQDFVELPPQRFLEKRKVLIEANSEVTKDLDLSKHQGITLRGSILVDGKSYFATAKVGPSIPIYFTDSPDLGRYGEVDVKEDGTFVCRGLPAGDIQIYFFEAAIDGRARAYGHSTNLTLSESEPERNLVINLKRIRISGTLKMPEGVSPLGAIVMLRQGFDIRGFASVDQEGRFIFEGIFPGEFNIWATLRPYPSVVVEIIADADREDITLQIGKKTGSVRVRIAALLGTETFPATNNRWQSGGVYTLFPKTRQHAYGYVSPERGGAETFYKVGDELLIPTLAEGEYIVEVLVGGFVAAYEKVSVKPEQESRLEVVLTRKGEILLSINMPNDQGPTDLENFECQVIQPDGGRVFVEGKSFRKAKGNRWEYTISIENLDDAGVYTISVTSDESLASATQAVGALSQQVEATLSLVLK